MRLLFLRLLRPLLWLLGMLLRLLRPLLRLLGVLLRLLRPLLRLLGVLLRLLGVLLLGPPLLLFVLCGHWRDRSEKQEGCGRTGYCQELHGIDSCVSARTYAAKLPAADGLCRAHRNEQNDQYVQHKKTRRSGYQTTFWHEIAPGSPEAVSSLLQGFPRTLIQPHGRAS